MSVQAELPKYKCHKEVWALQIKAIEVCPLSGCATITPEEEGYAPFRVEHGYVQKHRPTVGGYYVLYEGGYTSFSPAKPFESGYTRIEA